MLVMALTTLYQDPGAAGNLPFSMVRRI